MTRLAARVRAFLAARPCRCGHTRAAHRRWNDSRHCGACGQLHCPRFRRRRRGEEPTDLAVVCADHQVIEAVRAGDIDHALLLADPEFVGLLAALNDTGRRP